MSEKKPSTLKPDPQSSPDPHPASPPPDKEETALAWVAYDAWRAVIRAQSMAQRIADWFGDDLAEARIADCFEGIDQILETADRHLGTLHWALLEEDR
jgi:hypothetical protein